MGCLLKTPINTQHYQCILTLKSGSYAPQKNQTVTIFAILWAHGKMQGDTPFTHASTFWRFLISTCFWPSSNLCSKPSHLATGASPNGTLSLLPKPVAAFPMTLPTTSSTSPAHTALGACPGCPVPKSLSCSHSCCLLWAGTP